MKNLYIILFLFNFSIMNSQELFAIYPVMYPSIYSKTDDFGNIYIEKFDIEIKPNKCIYYKNEAVFEFEFGKYYEYLVEVFCDKGNYIIISPLPKTNYNGVASPYNIDRGIVLIFDYKNKKKFYLNFDNFKRIQFPEVFNSKNTESYHYTIKSINIEEKKMVLLQGGENIKEIFIDLFEF